MTYRGFSAGVHVAVRNKGRFLVLQRSAADTDDPLCWDLPGGGMRKGEQPVQAARREVLEEAGIHIVLGRLLNAWAGPYDRCWSVELLFEARYTVGTIALSREHRAFRWVSRQELFALRPKSEHVKRFVRFLKSTSD